MKKFFVILLLAVGVTACGSDADTSNQDQSNIPGWSKNYTDVRSFCSNDQTQTRIYMSPAGSISVITDATCP